MPNYDFRLPDKLQEEADRMAEGMSRYMMNVFEMIVDVNDCDDVDWEELEQIAIAAFMKNYDSIFKRVFEERMKGS